MTKYCLVCGLNDDLYIGDCNDDGKEDHKWVHEDYFDRRDF